MAKEFSIAVCGSPRVGKSTLVNALCGKQVANVSNSLNSNTDKIEKYVLKTNNTFNNDVASSAEHSITIYDTPGIESWTEKNVRSYFSNIMKESKPLCMIYCASPGSFARLDHLQWVIDTCIESNIFCALVCTNKYFGGSNRRNEVLKEFDSLLIRYHNMTRDENNIKYYGDVALCTAVNSIVYEDRDFNVRKEVEGINELIFGILTSLKNDKVVGWCYTIADNESFWSNMQEQIIKFYELSKPVVMKFLDEHGKEIATGLIPLILAAIKRKI
jgi:GTPase SAR1 family protein